MISWVVAVNKRKIILDTLNSAFTAINTKYSVVNTALIAVTYSDKGSFEINHTDLLAFMDFSSGLCYKQ